MDGGGSLTSVDGGGSLTRIDSSASPTTIEGGGSLTSLEGGGSDGSDSVVGGGCELSRRDESGGVPQGDAVPDVPPEKAAAAGQ